MASTTTSQTSLSQPSIELRPREPDSESMNQPIINPPSPQEFSLPPADSGWRAWSFLAACFWVEALVWGFPFSFGIFQEYYSTHEPFASRPSGIAAIGTTAMGLMYLGSPFNFALLQFYPLTRRPSAAVGLVVMSIALVGSSYATTVPVLILTQGVLYAVGGSLLYSPVILFLDEWFIRRKGIAFGTMWAGTGFAGVTVPYVMAWGLERYNYETILRAWAVTLLVLAGPLLWFIRPRVPVRSNQGNRKLNFHFVKTPQFWVQEAGIVLQGLGFFAPSIYLPTYARSLGYSSGVQTATLALLNGAAVFGCMFIGALVDRLHVTTVTGISTFGAVFSVLVLWGVSASLPALLIFSMVYGFFAGSYSSAWSGVLRDIKAKDNTAEPGLVFGFLAFGRGVGSVVCGPISETLVRNKDAWSSAALGYGTGYGPLIVFTGISALLGGMSVVARQLRWL